MPAKPSKKVKDLERLLQSIEILMTMESSAPYTEDRAAILHDLEVMRRDARLAIDIAKENEYLNKRNEIIGILNEPPPLPEAPLFRNPENFRAEPPRPITKEEAQCKIKKPEQKK